MKEPITHADLARRYCDWARSQCGLAERSLTSKGRDDHLALAEHYLKLAEGELTAAHRVVV